MKQMTIFEAKSGYLKKVELVKVKLVREKVLDYQMKISCPDDAVHVLEKILQGVDREYFAAMLLDSKNKVNALNVVSIGTLNSSLVHPREVFKTAILANAAGVILGHNHPSGNPEPSREDIQITNRLVESGKVLGIDVMDHVIIGDEKYISLREQGHI